MKVIILAGGRGLRLREETDHRPKPMTTVGGHPILWHIMKHYSHYGFNEFIVAAGYRGELIHEYFSKLNEPFQVQVIDTGEETATGGRLKRLEGLVTGETFMMTWGDAVSNIDLTALLDFHRSHGKNATVTAVHPPPRFGQLELKENQVTKFLDKPFAANEWINAAYFVLEPAVFSLIAGDTVAWEDDPMQNLSSEGELCAFRHEGFWQCADTIHELDLLRNLWNNGVPPWRI
jgi:glucose-1-phosphate cytidylyltransferase